MDINLEHYGIFVVGWMFLAIPVTLYLNRKKTSNSLHRTIFSLVSTLIPIVNLVYLIVLYKRNKLVQAK